MSFVVPDAVKAALAGSNAPCARILALEPDRVTVRRSWEADGAVLLNGQATYDRTRAVRRFGNVTLANKDGSLSPTDVDSYFFTGNYFRLERGVVLGGSPLYVPLATLIVSTFDGRMTGTLSVAGNDPLSLCQQAFGDVVTLDGRLTGEQAMLELLEPVLGDGSSWSLNAAGRTLGGRTRSYAEDDDRLNSAVSLATDLGCELFADRYGQPVLQPLPDPTAVAPSGSYTTGSDALLLDLVRSGSYQPFNRVVAIGTAPDGTSVRGQADITDTASPLHARRIGLRVAPYIRSAQIATQEQANAVAQSTLIRQALAQDAISAPVVPDVTIDEGDVVSIAEPISGTNDVYWLSQVTHPVVHGGTNLTGARIVPLFT